LKRLLRIEVAVALLLFAPLVGYAIAYFVAGTATRPAPVDSARATTGALPAASADAAVAFVRGSEPVKRAGG